MATPREDAAGSPGGGQEPALRRVIGPRLLVLFVVGDVLGTGIYATTGRSPARSAGPVAAVRHRVRRRPPDRGLVHRTRRQVPEGGGGRALRAEGVPGPFLTFIIAYVVMCSGLSSASAAARAFGGDYLAEFTDFFPPTFVAILFILALAALNLRGVSEFVKTNVVLTLVELTGLVVILAIGAWAVLNGEGEPSRLGEFQAEGGGIELITSVLGATALAFFAFVGFEDSVNMAEETKDPARVPARRLHRRRRHGHPLRPGPLGLLAPRRPPRARGVQRPAAGGRQGRRTRLPARTLRFDRSVRGHQLGADQHHDGVPSVLRHGERTHSAARPGPCTAQPPHPVVGIVFVAVLAVGLVSTGRSPASVTPRPSCCCASSPSSTSPCSSCAAIASRTNTSAPRPLCRCSVRSPLSSWPARCPTGPRTCTSGRAYCWPSASDCGASTRR